jgi:hypothetical protein
MQEHDDDAHRTPYDDAKAEVEAKLRKQQLTKPLTEKEMEVFCEAMVRNLDLKSSDLPAGRGWAHSWQSAQFGTARRM